MEKGLKKNKYLIRQYEKFLNKKIYEGMLQSVGAISNRPFFKEFTKISKNLNIFQIYISFYDIIDNLL